MERELIDTEIVKTFFNKNWIRKNELEIEEFSKRELKLENESTRLLERTIKKEL